MKNLLLSIVLFLFSCSALIGAGIRLDKPEYRLGEKIEITICLKHFQEQVEKTLPDGFKFEKFSSYIKIHKTVVAKELGELKIGPFNIPIGDTIYKTNHITVKVIDSLKNEKGTWIRYVKNNGRDYIIIEQNTNHNGWKKHAKLNRLKGFDFGSTSSCISGAEGKNKVYKTNYYACYDLTRKEGFTDEIKLDKSNFIKLPKNFNLPEIILK